MLTFANIIEKKKQNIELTEQEIRWVVDRYVKGIITDYQMSSFCMVFTLLIWLIKKQQI